MTDAFALAALWLALTVLTTILANHISVSMALVEVCVGIVPGTLAAHFFSAGPLLRVTNLKKYFPVKAGLWRKTVGFVKAVDGVSFGVA
jgi:ABC-type glutathione transport system ATPase component